MSVVPDCTPITSIFEVLTTRGSDDFANDIRLSSTVPKNHVKGFALVTDAIFDG